MSFLYLPVSAPAALAAFGAMAPCACCGRTPELYDVDPFCLMCLQDYMDNLTFMSLHGAGNEEDKKEAEGAGDGEGEEDAVEDEEEDMSEDDMYDYLTDGEDPEDYEYDFASDQEDTDVGGGPPRVLDPQFTCMH